LRYFTSTILTELVSTGVLGRSLRSRGIEQIVEIKLTPEEDAAATSGEAYIARGAIGATGGTFMGQGIVRTEEDQ